LTGSFIEYSRLPPALSDERAGGRKDDLRF
jgi:hypothetical protein